ncbi:thioredoxin [Candidatus Daviesbacteria bacterium RIFCSPLOWO2_02_FULL_40_8]|uniref:Thioredoxin n=1 Tax=Candidatus Daviesbacteria bacterium RIFCSPLOWO2_01_FULL_40_24 TaxID=1797787 RepID=A0A1F5MK06_9BACT|nr:MAG: thioredoxin [Candidatus Daviesbacteria bacterium RIFCSPHIGHO2_01_FULL_41_45]OGE34374.1 MAG: thioredoxin [Candidatus Daviesbacteria bacterium RIFCSPHIGHO2_02_FULL_41_14]OGE65692.1 MAG: thioredoxin [Candidatus Daviesbacteria bacterium RIFCSPLOWO2_01_FULL_40_24]OGE66100.1 MAG: thioredoxin [Candidatus Daviesbacteria bacterium RIFCSPLOWO2_02_FULL_40_8]
MTKLLDFWAPWCQPCKMMEPVIHELEEEMKDRVEIVKINVDEDSEGVAAKFGVMSIPTFVVLKDDQETGRKVGFTQKTELLKLLA